jgi:shikimate dehydrogenase
MLTPDRTRLEVWGDPIAHSRSPALHTAAYRVLGLDWTYGRRRVGADGFASEFAGLDRSWRGLSLTMPLKTAAYGASVTHDRRAELTGAVNTILLTDDGPRGFNTDVPGIVAALGEAGVVGVTRGRVLGAGATATSALVALAELGATEVSVVARRLDAVAALAPLAATLGLSLTAHSLPARSAFRERAQTVGDTPSDPDISALSRDHSGGAVDVTISTLPATADLDDATTDGLAAGGGVLLDVSYGQGTTAVARAWQRTGGTTLSGLGMLLHQALRQVRVFVNGDPDEPLDDEAAVLAALRLALVGD